jgi:uncharacterized membrane protein HdeD (DUF308 family)
MSRQSSFPPVAFLVLGVLSLIAAAIFAFRSATIEATAERVWSAIVFGGFGVFWLAAYASARRDSTA